MIKRDQRGFTLIELLVVLAIISLITVAATTTTFQVLTSTKRSNDHMTAIRQVQNAGYWISNDALMAESVVVDDDPETPEFLTLNWTEWDEGKKKKDSKYHLVTYYFEDMADGLKKLKRQYLIYEDGDVKGDEVTLVAEYIYIDDSATSFSPEPDGRWILTIQARKGTATETREYEVTPRVNMQRLMQ